MHISGINLSRTLHKDEFFDTIDEINPRAELIPDRLFFQRYHDVCCNLEGEILVSEKVKNELENLDLIGVEFKKFDKYEIIMPEETT